MLDHYGNEHFCPITMVRLFGLSSDEMDEPGLPPPPLSRSSHAGDIGTTLGESESGLEGTYAYLFGFLGDYPPYFPIRFLLLHLPAQWSLPLSTCPSTHLIF